MVFAFGGHRIFTFLTVAALILSMLIAYALNAGVPGELGVSPQLTSHDMQNAVIKTQRAADRIEGGIRGIDVSKYNGTINWKKVAADNIEFAFIRATCGYQPQGEYKLVDDPLFLRNADEAHANGIKVGAYHVAWFLDREIMLNEARTFVGMIKRVNITYPVILDIEYNPGRLSRNELSELAKEFCDIVSAEGYTIFIYSYSNFFSSYLDLDKLGDYKLWVANYTETPKNIYHSIWQHTSLGKVSGISGNVDINIAYPNFELRKFVPVSVSRTASDLIKDRLREKYKLNVPQTGLAGIHEAVNSALQKEINVQWDISLPITGSLGKKQLQCLNEVNFTGKTKGNITYLVQAKLFYLGYYKKQPTAVFDQNTRNAIRSMQIARKMDVTGELSTKVLEELFG